METSVIDFLFATLDQLVALYPEAGWISIAAGVLLSLCGLCTVATIWMPAPAETVGVYAVIYRWVHALALHFGQNRGAVADGKSETVKAEVKAVTGK